MRRASEPQRARAFLGGRARSTRPRVRGASARRSTSILEHVRAGRRITIHGDYDVDGVCSTAMLVRALRALGADVDSYLPDRASDGYGLSGGDRAAARGARHAAAGDRRLRDHGGRGGGAGARAGHGGRRHRPPRAARRRAAAATRRSCTRRVCGYPCRELCATAVAYKLAQARVRGGRARSRASSTQDLDLVALATVADVVPLVGENRTLVRRGLRALAATRKPGLRALMARRAASTRRARRARGRLRARAAAQRRRSDVPRGRGAGADADRGPASGQRRSPRSSTAPTPSAAQVEKRIRFEAEAQIAELGSAAAYVLAGEGWHAGVIGIVASRLAERHTGRS